MLLCTRPVKHEALFSLSFSEEDTCCFHKRISPQRARWAQRLFSAVHLGNAKGISLLPAAVVTSSFLAWIGAAFSTDSLPVTSPVRPSSRRQLSALCLKCHFFFLHENKSWVNDSSCWSLCESFSFRYQRCCKRQRLFFILSALFVPFRDAWHLIKDNKRRSRSRLRKRIINDQAWQMRVELHRRQLCR